MTISCSSLSAAEAASHHGEPKYLCMAVEKKYLWDNGQTIYVKILGGTDELQNVVKKAAKEWEEYANITFNFTTQTESHVRISFEQGKGSYSVVGKNALDPQYTGKSTMNLDIASQDALGRMAVALHEFGHVLGCIHEHCSPSATIEWDRNAVYKHYEDTNGWTKEKVDDNIFCTYRKEDLQFSSTADSKSIMMYHFNASLANGSVPATRNSKLSTEDRKFIAEVYPSPIQPRTVRHSTTTTW